MWNWIQKLSELNEEGQPFVVVTIARCNGSTPRETGAKMLVTESTFFGTIGGGQLELHAINDARKCLKQGRPQVIDYPLHAAVNQCCGGVVQMLFEPQNTGPHLFVFGAGHVGQALAQVMSGTPFNLTLVDERPEWIEAQAIPSGIQRFSEGHESFLKKASWNPQNSYVVIMTHEHDLDYTILKALIPLVPSKLKFLGLIGSETKWKSFQHRLHKDHVTDDEIKRVHCPVGLHLGGGKTPQEVAISIAAQLLQLYYAA